jgi:hypothetical protein
MRRRKSILTEPFQFKAIAGKEMSLPVAERILPGDEFITSLTILENGVWKQVGTELISVMREGAPFTFGRALGLGSEDLEHGTQLFIDGVAVFNRVLSEKELKSLSFVQRTAMKKNP